MKEGKKEAVLTNLVHSGISRHAVHCSHMSVSNDSCLHTASIKLDHYASFQDMGGG